MKLCRPSIILALAVASIVVAAKDCGKFTREKECTNKKNGKQCKYEQRACVAKSTCEQQTKKGKCKKAGDCTWEGEKKGCVDTFMRRRRRALTNRTSALFFMHIPKTAGRSATRWLQDAVPRASVMFGHGEVYLRPFQSVDALAETRRTWSSARLASSLNGLVHPRRGIESLLAATMVRSPRSHVVSMYMECCCSNWGRRVAPTVPTRPGNWTAGFRAWLDHFDPGTWSQGDYHCYNPHNMLARALTCDDPRRAMDSRCDSCCADAGDRRATCSHHAADRDALIPDATAAVRAVRFDLGFVGVTELFTESLCLLGFLLDGTLPGKSCVVDGDDSPIVPPDDRGFELHHEAHGVPPHDVRAVPRATLDVVDAYTAVDREVYRAAFTRLVADLRALERRAGVRVLSPERLADAKAAVGYVWAVDGFEQG